MKNILCIGDSLTEGDYGSEPEGTANVHPEGYPYFLEKKTGWTITNAGVCGIRPSAYLQYKLPTIRFEKPYDLVIIMLGTNGPMSDTLDSGVVPFNDPSQYVDNDTGNYCRIIESVQKKSGANTEIILCTCPFVNPQRRPRNAENVRLSNIVIPKIAARYGLKLFDVRKELGVDETTTAVYQPLDGLHFGYAGYEKLADYFYDKLKSIGF